MEEIPVSGSEAIAGQPMVLQIPQAVHSSVTT